MKFNQAEQVDSICYQMRLGDYPRGKNRALINSLFNGAPPYADEDAEDIQVNVNFLEATRIGHDARSQCYQNFLKPGNFFNCTTDSGAQSRRQTYSAVVTKQINKIMKRSIPFMECFRSKFALNILHGIAPAAYKDKERWRPEAMGVEDVLVPANVLLSMENLPFFAIRRSFTAPELIKLTQGPQVDKGWNQPLVKRCIRWVDEQSASLMSSNWPEVWSPEKIEERIKGDGGYYIGDSVPTIDVFDFYFWSDEGKQAGWRRRMILDAWSSPTIGNDGKVSSSTRDGDLFKGGKRQFLYNPGNRIFASSREQIINWQFADLSAVAPFRYHSVRSLGFLLYSVCHLQNRMRCRFTESVFEQMLMYFRVKSREDSQRALKVDLVNRGFIDDTIDFIKAADRYQVNPGLVELGLRENSNLIAMNSSSYTTQPGQGARGNVEKTKFEVMTEVNAMTSLVSAALTQAYYYQVPEYREIFRRFTIKNSRDPEVREFQAACISGGVPGSILYNPACWEIEPERVLGAGNKTLEMAIAQQLMEYRNLYDPQSQRRILRDVTLAITDDPDRTEALVPLKPYEITDSVHDAQLAAGSLMMGLPVAIKDGTNHIEYVETLMATLASLVQRGTQEMRDIMGMDNIARHIGERIQYISQDENEKARVKQYGDQLGKLMNMVKAQAQQIQEQQQASGANGSPQDAEAAAKVQAMLIQANAKAEVNSKSHAQKTTQRQIQFELQQQQEQQRFQMEMAKKQAEADLDLRAKEVEIELSRQKAQASADKKPKASVE